LENWKGESMKKLSLAILLVGLILGSMYIPGVLAADGREPKGKEEPNRIVMNTASLTAVFEGKKPKITFYLTNTTKRAVEYQLNFKRLIEFNDTNRDEVYQKGEEVAWAELEPLTWTHTGFYNITGPTRGRIGIGINFTYSGPVQIQRPGTQPERPTVTVKFAAKIYQYDVKDVKTVGYQGFEYSVIGGAEVKVDVILSGWPFGAEKYDQYYSRNPKLALEVHLHSGHNRFEVEERNGRVLVNANLTETRERKMNQTDAVEQKIHYLNATGKVAGFFKFVNVAIVKAAGTSRTVKVYSSYIAEPELGERQFKLFLAYPKFEGTLEHDPSFGIGEPAILTPEETIPEFPISTAIVLLMTLSAVMLILHLKTQSRREHKKPQNDSILCRPPCNVHSHSSFLNSSNSCHTN